MDTATATALANEARRQEARAKVASLQGASTAVAALAAAANAQSLSAMQDLVAARAELAALDSTGPGLTDAFGEYSTLEQAMRLERFAGKGAVVDLVKAKPDTSEADATAAYTAAALAARPADRQWLLIDPAALRQEYSANLVAAGYIPVPTWEAWRAFIIATDKAVILGLS